MGSDHETTGRQPFAGLKVIEICRVLASPFATYQLALLGADVIKIEDPERGGDSLRYRRGSDSRFGAGGMATFFLSQNANKRSMTLNLRTAEGRAILRDMLSEADVLVENLRSGTMARFGLAYDDLRALNPRLVHCSLTGYGQTGPKRRHAAYDPVIQAASGMMSITGTPGTAPLKAGAPVADYAAGYAACFGIASALFERSRSGMGQHVDVAMLDASILMFGNIATDVLTAGSDPKPHGNRSPAETYGNACFSCLDGQLLAIAAIEDHHRQQLWRVLERPDIPLDPRFADELACMRNVEALHAEMTRAFAARPAQEWEDALNAAGVPAMRVRTIREALGEEQVRQRGLFHTFDDVPGVEGAVTVPLAPFVLSASPVRLHGPPPRLGADTDSILAARGHSAASISRLRSTGVL